MELRPIRSMEERERVTAAAAEDQHLALFPTHALYTAAGEIVGCASLPWTPTIYCWTHTQKVKALDSTRALARIESITLGHGYGSLILPCSESSPFFSVLPRRGYTNIGPAHFFQKTIRPEII